MPRSVRVLTQAVLFVTPWFLRRRALSFFFGYRLHPTSRIGFSFVDVADLTMGAGARIGHLNLIHGLVRFEMGEGAEIGKWNQVYGIPVGSHGEFRDDATRQPVFTMGRQTSITSRHIIACLDRVDIGAFTTIGGAGSQIFTHGVEIETNRQRCAPVSIGSYCLITTRTVILKGSRLADYCILAAGTVFNRPTSEPYGLYAGVPARRAKELPVDAPYFSRSIGAVD